MLHAIHSFLYGATPARFASSLSLRESVERLRASTKRSAFGALAGQAATGKVTEGAVSLQRVIPFVGNSFKPFFVGKFESTELGVVLVGRFTMHWAVKAFMTFWFGFCALWTVLVALAVGFSPNKWYLPLFGFGMLCAGALLVQIGKWFARNDVAWLSAVISSALSGKGAA